MLRCSFTSFVILATLLLDGGNAQLTGCVTSLAEIFLAEQPLVNDEDTDTVRTYVLCPNSTFQPGRVNQETGEIAGGDFPLVCRRNCHIKCGDNGSSDNNCNIGGIAGSYGIFMIPYLVFDDKPEDATNIIVEGVTVEGFKSSGQIPTLAASPKGSITFKDCKWRDNTADPLFVIDEFLLGSAPGRRLEANGFKYPPAENQIGRRLADIPEEERVDVAVRVERELQAASAFGITFEKCHFEDNQPVSDPKTQGGLSIVRIRAADPLNAFDQVGKMDATFVQNTFQNNTFNSQAGTAFHTLIDFYSEGKLTMRENCFLDSPVSQFGSVTVQASAQVVNDANFVDPDQDGLSCDFIALIDPDYMFLNACGPNAFAPSCQSDVDDSTGGGGVGVFCFPGDSILQVEDKGLVLMKDIKLGEKVLVEGGKYEPIYSFGHYTQKIEAHYLRLVSTTNSLELSKDHMVFVEGGRSIPASHVKVGDKLELADGNLVSVKEIRAVQRQGAYAPFTASGTVIVNGIKASNFVAFQDSETLLVAGFGTGLTFQFLAHFFETPHRSWCNFLSACADEQYTANGVSTWVDIPHKTAIWLTNPDSTLALTVPVLVMFCLLASPAISLFAIGALLLVRRKFKLKVMHCKI